MTLKLVQAVDYQGNYAYSRGSLPEVINLDNVNRAVLVPPERTRNVFDDITRVHFNDGTHIDIFGKPEDVVKS